MAAASMPTLDVCVIRRWTGGALEPGEKARLPAELARRLEKVGAVRILQQAAPVEKALPVATPEDPMVVAERAPVAVAEPVPPRRRRR